MTFLIMVRSLAILVLVLLMSCSKQDSADRFYPQERHAIELASEKCGNASKITWLRDIIRQAESDSKYKGAIYAIEYSSGVAFLHQPWLSSCFGCLVYNCEGENLLLSGSVMDEIIGGATEDNIIYTSTY